MNKYLPSFLQIKTITQLSDVFNGLLYLSTMGYRPKLALRNLGQQSLIIGEVGIKPYLKAVRTPNTEEVKQLLSQSDVLTSRKLAFAPETETALTRRTIQKVSRSAFFLYRGADWLNVRNGFLAGYYEARSQGKSHQEAIKRGDEVAAKTQFLYLRGNRSALARGFGLSPALGRTASVFTTWPANWVELMLGWSKPGHRVKVLRYLGLNVALLYLGYLLGVKAWKYTGITSPLSLKEMVTGGLPVTRILEKPQEILHPNIIKDIEKSIDDDDIRELFIYTWETE